MSTSEDLEAARQRIAALENEVALLRALAQYNSAAADLRVLLTQLGAASALGAPTTHTQLLEQIVQAAKHVLRADGGTLYLVDESSGEMVFEVALGKGGELLRGTRFPLGQGVAGWVAASGQAIAIADVQQDPQWASGIGKQLGYAPRTMLAMPLQLRDSVIGVLQLMDKDGGDPFSAGDMATLGLFAQQAAVAIAQSRAMSSLSALLRSLLTEQDWQGAGSGGSDPKAAAQLAAFAADTENSAEFQDMLKLARMLGEIARQSEAGRRLSLQVAEAIVTYLRAQPDVGK